MKYSSKSLNQSSFSGANVNRLHSKPLVKNVIFMNDNFADLPIFNKPYRDIRVITITL